MSTDTPVNLSTLRSRRHRANTGAVYDKARASATRRAVQIFRRENPGRWELLIEQELKRLKRGPLPGA